MARDPRTPTCRDCARFVDDPAAIEAALPGITALGSAYGSVRGDAGICEASGRFMEPLDATTCAPFVPRRVAG